jgi:glycerol-3-phosphate cytidylyltransferase-like family protein
MRIMISIAATLLSHEHIGLLKRAKEHGTVVVGLKSDDDILGREGYRPDLPFSARKEIMEALSSVDEVVETPWLIDDDILSIHRIDALFDGADCIHSVSNERLIHFPQSRSFSTSDLCTRSVAGMVALKNRKALFSPGPSSLLTENILGLDPCFGRGDALYDKIEEDVLTGLKKMSGHNHVVRLHGSASLALEVVVRNFIWGKVLIVTTGYYADRLASFCRSTQKLGNIQTVDIVGLQAIDDVSEPYDWLITASTETSSGLRNDPRRMRSLADRIGARLFVDATGSIGLEDGHELADVVGYSSCKGLFGLTGASFIGYNEEPQIDEPSFYLNFSTHARKRMTGPYHAICSLHQVLPRHDDIRASAQIGKRIFCTRYAERLVRPASEQPVLCTLVRGAVVPLDDDVVTYSPRDSSPGTSVICHLGEAHLGSAANGAIYNRIAITD